MTDGISEICRIAMWSGPRNISTALMRSFENRSDCVAVDEPFYAHFLERTGIDHPGRDAVLASQPRNAADVVDRLMAPLPRGIRVQYQKHMSHHIVPDASLDWARDIHNCFLLREPRAMIASYVKKRADPVLDDLGFRQLAEIYDFVSPGQKAAPIVIDSDDLLRDPAAILRVVCQRLNIPFEQTMLAWPPGPRTSDGAWAPWWYANVEKSTAFESRPPFEGQLPDHLEALARQAMPYYNRLARYKIM